MAFYKVPVNKLIEKDNLVIQIEQEAFADRVKIWIIDKGRGYGRPHIGHVVDGEFEFTEFEEEEELGPTFNFPTQFWNMLALAIGEYEPPIEKDVAEADLKATKYHLEDMRRLVFKRSKK